MTTPEKVLEIARGELGYTETPNNITKYGKWYGLDGNPWCAMFVSWVFHKAGLPLPASTSKGFAYTPSGAHWFKSGAHANASGWLNHNSPNVKPGDVVFYYYPSMNRIAHVGIVETKLNDTNFIAIEGNTNGDGSRDGGEVERRVRTTSFVGERGGFGRPAFSVQTGTGEDDMIIAEHGGGVWYTYDMQVWVPFKSKEDFDYITAVLGNKVTRIDFNRISKDQKKQFEFRQRS